MIGSLLLAVAFTAGVGLTNLNEIVEGSYTSRINGEQGTLVDTHTFNLAYVSSGVDYHYYEVGIGYDDYWHSNNDNVDDSRDKAINGSLYDSIDLNIGGIEDDSAVFMCTNANTQYTVNAGLNTVTFNQAVCLYGMANDDYNCIEFNVVKNVLGIPQSNNTSMLVCCYSLDNLLAGYQTVFDDGTDKSVNWFGMYSDYGLAYDSGSTLLVRRTNHSLGKFWCYIFLFQLESSNMSLTINCNFCRLHGSDYINAFYAGYSQGRVDGYQFGYDDGYNQGTIDGYQNGYAEGLNIATSNGSFLNLMGAVADTPIRFLYNLFSFELFGTSMLTIIMSLLTACMVFYLIRKIL